MLSLYSSSISCISKAFKQLSHAPVQNLYRGTVGSSMKVAFCTNSYCLKLNSSKTILYNGLDTCKSQIKRKVTQQTSMTFNSFINGELHYKNHSTSQFHIRARLKTKDLFQNCKQSILFYPLMKVFHVSQSDFHTCIRSYTKATETMSVPIETKIKAKVRGIQKDISPLTTRRVVRRKKSKDSQENDKEIYDVMAFATSEEINLESLLNDLKRQGLYSASALPQDVEDALHVEANYRVDDVAREIFFFREGSVVFWNMPEFERNEVLKFLRRHQEDSYDMSLVQQEFEHADFTFTDNPTGLVDNEIQLKKPQENTDGTTGLEHHTLEKYTFSNALALSVKLAVWEESLARYVDSIEWVLEDMKRGKKIVMKREDVLRKSGELFTLRHLINLSSDLLDTPDFYWDREPLEKLYIRTCNHLNIARRTKVMNEKLNYCAELTALLTDHLNDRHHTRLEWMIIILITVEVGFEILHTIEKYF